MEVTVALRCVSNLALTSALTSTLISTDENDLRWQKGCLFLSFPRQIQGLRGGSRRRLLFYSICLSLAFRTLLLLFSLNLTNVDFGLRCLAVSGRR